MSTATMPNIFRQDATIISLVGFAHGTSHFFHLMLPPLFPWLMNEYSLSYTQVGALMSVFFVVSGIGQACAGFLVDRWGAHRVLCLGVGLLASSGILIAIAPALWGLYLGAFVAGLGNSVFHPADFALLNHQVSQTRLGHAFSVHGLSGNLGWALGPLAMTTTATAFGWRMAALVAAVVGGASLTALWFKREELSAGLADEASRHGAHRMSGANASPIGRSHQEMSGANASPIGRSHQEMSGANASPIGRSHQEKRGSGVSVVGLLKLRLTWFAFGFFFFSTLGFGALQNFAPSLLRDLYGLSLGAATSALTAYLIGGAAGLATGGFLAGAAKGQEKLVGFAFLCSAALALLLAFSTVPGWAVIGIMALMGFGVGIAGPSRDMLVRKSTAARLGTGAFGRIYGLVYSGLDVGLAVAPLIFGMLMDAGRTRFVFVGVSLSLVFAIIAAQAIAGEARQTV